MASISLTGEVIRSRRKELGLSRTQLASAVGIPVYRLVLIEKGQGELSDDLKQAFSQLLALSSRSLAMATDKRTKAPAPREPADLPVVVHLLMLLHHNLESLSLGRQPCGSERIPYIDYLRGYGSGDLRPPEEARTMARGLVQRFCEGMRELSATVGFGISQDFYVQYRNAIRFSVQTAKLPDEEVASALMDLSLEEMVCLLVESIRAWAMDQRGRPEVTFWFVEEARAKSVTPRLINRSMINMFVHGDMSAFPFIIYSPDEQTVMTMSPSPEEKRPSGGVEMDRWDLMNRIVGLLKNASLTEIKEVYELTAAIMGEREGS